jgi:hypothetical protein
MHSESIQVVGLTRDERESNIGHKNHKSNPIRTKNNKPGKHDKICENGQTHVHEFLGSTKLAEEGDDRHNHRFAGVTSQAIPRGTSHVHAILTNTDFFENHHHEIGVTTGLAIPVGNGKHVHFVEGTTTLDDGHVHNFQFATLIESPLT